MEVCLALLCLCVPSMQRGSVDAKRADQEYRLMVCDRISCYHCPGAPRERHKQRDLTPTRACGGQEGAEEGEEEEKEEDDDDDEEEDVVVDDDDEKEEEE